MLVLGILCSGSASVCLCASVYCVCVCVITGAQTFLNLVVGTWSTPSTDCTPYISVPPFCIADIGSAFHIKRERVCVLLEARASKGLIDWRLAGLSRTSCSAYTYPNPQTSHRFAQVAHWWTRIYTGYGCLLERTA